MADPAQDAPLAGEQEVGERRRDEALVSALINAVVGADPHSIIAARHRLLQRLGDLRASRDRHRDALADALANWTHAEKDLADHLLARGPQG